MHDIRALTGGGRDESIDVHGTPVFGLPVDHETRCTHWHEATDVVAIRFRCCGRFHPCSDCHEAVAGHRVEVWPVEQRHERALLCGVCGTTLRIDEYLAVEACPGCGAGFNPGCRLHRHLYFA
jgi:uncharacterized CHY-type Zn-finger protein